MKRLLLGPFFFSFSDWANFLKAFSFFLKLKVNVLYMSKRQSGIRRAGSNCPARGIIRLQVHIGSTLRLKNKLVCIIVQTSFQCIHAPTIKGQVQLSVIDRLPCIIKYCPMSNSKGYINKTINSIMVLIGRGGPPAIRGPGIGCVPGKRYDDKKLEIEK